MATCCPILHLWLRLRLCQQHCCHQHRHLPRWRGLNMVSLDRNGRWRVAHWNDVTPRPPLPPRKMALRVRRSSRWRSKCRRAVLRADTAPARVGRNTELQNTTPRTRTLTHMLMHTAATTKPIVPPKATLAPPPCPPPPAPPSWGRLTGGQVRGRALRVRLLCCSTASMWTTRTPSTCSTRCSMHTTWTTKVHAIRLLKTAKNKTPHIFSLKKLLCSGQMVRYFHNHLLI